MDITTFINCDSSGVSENKLKKHLGNLVTCNRFDSINYSFMVEFIETNGTLRNLDIVIGLLNDNSYVDKKIVHETFPTYFTIKKGKLKINKNIWRNLAHLDHLDHLNCSICLTSEQLKCGKQLLKFIKDPSQTTFGLYGYAGTGKTTSTVEIIAYLIRNEFIKSVVFTAPTNKAVNVIKAKFRTLLKDIYEKIYSKILEKDFDFESILDKLYIDKIKIDFITIHRLLEFKIDYNSDGGLIFMRNNCGKKKTSLMREYEIIVIDECSMIPMDLLDAIFNDINMCTEKMDNKKISDQMKIPKILFTGDPAQLPPVNETQSFVFLKNPEDLTIDEYSLKMHNSSIVSLTSDIDDILEEKRKKLISNIMNIKSFTLKKVVRSKIDNVTNFCYEIRKWVNGEDENPNFGDFHNKKGIKIYKYIPTISKIDTKWFRKCLKYIKKNKPSIILTWTNRQTDMYNDFIRKKIFGNDKLEKYVIGDILMLTEFYCLDSNSNSNSNAFDEKNDANKFYTSDQIYVLHAKIKVHQMKQFEFVSNKSIRKIKKSLLIENSCRNITNFINNAIRKKQYKYWKLNVNKIGESDDMNHVIKVLHDSELENYKKLKDEVSGYITNFSVKSIEDFKDISKQIENLVIKPLWKQWHEVFVMPFASVNYGYSITCHKGQGSNFYNVFVDIDDIGKNGNLNEVKKCIYTAITRTINKLYILI
jgi:hypothetical protein